MPNENVILIARTKKDISTKYIYYWADQIKQEAELLGFHVIDLQDENFEEDKIKKYIEEFDPFLIFLNGHGTQYSIKGYDGETDVILRCKNDHLFNNRIVYALSCHSSVILGKSSRNKGCRCYIGYKDRVRFPMQELDNVLDDFVTEPFMIVSNEIVLTLLKGGNPEEAYQNSQKLFDELIKHWKKQNKPEAPTIVKWLQIIKKRQVMSLA
jgi:hypothetical protein